MSAAFHRRIQLDLTRELVPQLKEMLADPDPEISGWVETRRTSTRCRLCSLAPTRPSCLGPGWDAVLGPPHRQAMKGQFMNDSIIPCSIDRVPKVPFECHTRIEERQMLVGILEHFRPQVVVESGTYKGGTASLFAQLVPKVICIDPFPMVTEAAFREQGMTNVQIIPSPSQLILPTIWIAVPWLFFHDSVHTGKHLVFEVTTALSRGAMCACWHDVALIDRPNPQSPMPFDCSMMDGMRELQRLGYPAERLQKFEHEETDFSIIGPQIWTGSGFSLPKP